MYQDKGEGLEDKVAQPLPQQFMAGSLWRANALAPGAEPEERSIQELRMEQATLELQIADLRKSQIELEDSRNRYIDLYEYAPVGYFTLDAAGTIIEANHTGTSMLGVGRDALHGMCFGKFIRDPQHAGCWSRLSSGAGRCTKAQNCKVEVERSDGTRFHARIDCWHLETTNTPSMRVALVDITEHERAEEEMRIAAVAFESQEGIMVTNAKGVVVRVNQAFSRLTGYGPSEMVGRTPAKLKSGRHDNVFYKRIWEALREKYYWQGELLNRRKSGKVSADWLTISAVRGCDGNITHYVATFSDITRNKEAEAEIHRLAYYDPLTHLPNRRLLYDRLWQALASSKRHERFGAVLFLDLDNFKALNDTKGHDYGDMLLIEVAQRLTDAVREGDTVARLGGDEFVLLLEDLSSDASESASRASMVCSKILDTVAAPYLLNGVEFGCTASIGITLFYNHNETVDELLKHADIAMYHAKRTARNSLRFFDPAMQKALIDRSSLENDLRHALDRGQLRLHYQIQVNNERRVIGAEALIRWQHPERGMIPPDQFIPLAEETGLIIQIGSWVLKSACAQLKKWSDNPVTRDLQLSINVSPRQFHQPDFVDQVQQEIVAAGINPERLKIELTESLALDNLDDTISTMKELIEVGVSLSMDDFGTGYSSLTHLKQLPLDQLKIDQSFVRDLDSDPSDAAIVKAIITMGRTFGLNVIAEGVETERQVEILDQYGCRAYQGYMFGKPLPSGEFEGLLAQYSP